MDITRFTTRTQEAIAGAIRAATAAGHRQLEAVHLLDALLGQQETLVRPLLTAAGSDPDAVALATRTELGRLPTATGSTVAAPTYSRAAVQALTASQDLAAELKDDYAAGEHLLIALAGVDSPARRVLTQAGADADALRGALPQVRRSPITTPRVDLRGAREVRRGPHRPRGGGEDRPGHRA